MEEKVIIKSETNAEKVLFTFMIIAVILAFFVFSFLMIAEVFDNAFACVLISVLPFGLIFLVGIILYSWLNSYEMIVTNKRVYGKISWGERVDLPLDSISSTYTTSLFRGVAVATSSGRINFLMMKNSSEIYEKINALLVERQKAEPKVSPVQVSPSVSSADELKKFKELLDSGIITQEEFDAKKKKLLGL